jgi:hypothetical protein
MAAWTAGAASAEADLYTPPANSPFLITEATAAALSYNPSLELFGAKSTATFALEIGSLIPARDIVSSFTMAAHITNSGQVLNGSFSLIGQSTALGISSPTKLLSGNIIGVGGFQGMIAPGVSASVLQFYVSGLVVNDALEDVTGSYNYAVIDFYGFPPAFDSAGLPQFAVGYSNTTATDAPGIFLVSSLPAPGSLAAYGSALLMLAFWRRCKTRQ